MKCPNKLNSEVADQAAKNLEKYRATCKKLREKNSKKNLAKTNFLDFDDVSQQRIQEQVLQTNTKSEVGDTTSVISAVTSTSQQSKKQDTQGKRNTGYIFIVGVQVFAAGSPLKEVMPISIQSNLPHILLQLGNDLDCPVDRCLVHQVAVRVT